MSNFNLLKDQEIIEELSYRLKQFRLQKGMTQKDLSEKCGINRCTIRDIENGKSVTIKTIITIMRGLEILDILNKAIPNLIEESPVFEKKLGKRQRIRH